MLRRIATLVALGVRAELRNSGLRLLGIVGAVAAGVFAWNTGDVAGSTAIVLALWLGRAFGVAACLWLAYAAMRDLDEKTGAIFRSKPFDGASWVFARCLTGLCLWLGLMGAAFLAAA